MTPLPPAPRAGRSRPPFALRALARALPIALFSMAATTALAQQTQTDSSADQKKDSQPVTTLPTVTITGQFKPPVLGNVITIDGSELNQANSMADVVRNQPLISAPDAVTGRSNIWNGSGTTGYNIRGLEGNRIGLDVDGVNLPYAASMPDAASNYATGIGRDYIDPELFRQVRIASGTPSAGSSENDGLGGHVSFISKTPEDYLANQDTYLGLKEGYASADRSWNDVVTGAARAGDVQALVVYSRRDGHETENYGDVADSESDDWHSNALLTRFVWTPSTYNKLGLTLEGYKRTDERNIGTNIYSGYVDGVDQKSTTKRNLASLDDELLTPDFFLFDKIKVQGYYQDSYKKDYTVAPVDASNYTRYINTGYYTKTSGLNVEASKQLGDNDLLVYGLQYSWTKEQRPWTEYRYTNTTGALVSGYPNTVDRMAYTVTNMVDIYARDEHHFTLFGHDAYLTPGLKAEYSHAAYSHLSDYATDSTATKDSLKNNRTGFVTPTLNLTYEIKPKFDVYAQYSRGVRVPTASERTGIFENAGGFGSYGIIGNPDLKNETSNSFEFGTKGEVTPGITLDASAFYTKYHNFIDWRTVTATNYTLLEYKTENIADAKIFGTQVSTKFDLGHFLPQAQGFSVSLAAGLTKGESRDDEGNSGGINSVAPGKALAMLAYDDPSGKYGLNLTATTVRGKKASDDDASDTNASSNYFRVPGYTKYDFGAYWNVNKRVTLNLAVNNLTDKKYWDYSSVRMLTTESLYDRSSATGRNVAVNAEIRF